MKWTIDSIHENYHPYILRALFRLLVYITVELDGSIEYMGNSHWQGKQRVKHNMTWSITISFNTKP